MLERDAFVASCAQKLDPVLQDWGLRFKHMEVVELNLPPEYRDAVQMVTLAGFGKQKAIIDAQAEAEVMQLKAQAQANSRLAAGSADVRVYALMKAHGLDPVKMESIRTLMEYAKAPGSTSGGSLVSGDIYKPQVFASLSQVLLDPTIPNDIKNGVRELLPQDALVTPALTDASGQSELVETRNAPSDAGTDPSVKITTAEQIDEVLDNLDVQLAAGKISEATYDALKTKWEKRLEAINKSS